MLSDMFRYVIAGCSLFLYHVDALAVATETLRPFRFAEVKYLRETEGLPPKLKVVFDIMCNEKFLKVIRHDKTDPKTRKTIVAVGVLVEENLLSSCTGESTEMEASAGKTFSGGEFSISRIKR